MRAIIFAIAAVLFSVCMAVADIIPVDAWPSTVTLKDKIIYNATVKDCVKAGYRLKPAKPDTPAGKQIKSETLVQDDADESKATFVIVYEDAPIIIPPVIVPEVLTNVPASKVTFSFTTNGEYRGVVWTDAPKSNGVVVVK